MRRGWRDREDEETLRHGRGVKEREREDGELAERKPSALINRNNVSLRSHAFHVGLPVATDGPISSECVLRASYVTCRGRSDRVVRFLLVSTIDNSFITSRFIAYIHPSPRPSVMVPSVVVSTTDHFLHVGSEHNGLHRSG